MADVSGTLFATASLLIWSYGPSEDRPPQDDIEAVLFQGL